MTVTKKAWTRTRAEFEKKLRAKERYYHINHEFHIRMNEGNLNKQAVQGWVANRFYYQTTIPVKDAAIIANCLDRYTRRQWYSALLITMGPKAIRTSLRLG